MSNPEEWVKDRTQILLDQSEEASIPDVSDYSEMVSDPEGLRKEL